MKKLALFVSFAAILMVGCKKDNPVVPEIICDTDVVNVPVAGTEDEDIFVTFTSNVNWTASIKENAAWVSVSPASGTSADGRVKLIVLPTEENDPREATLVLTADTAVKEIKVVQAQVDAFSLAETSAEVGEEGGNVEIKAMTNIEWTVTIPSDCDWVSLVNVKAYGEAVKTVKVEPYDELDGYREVTLTVAAGGQESDFTISQYGPESCLWSVDMRDYVAMTASFTNSVEETVPTNVSMALYDGNVVVCAGDGTYPVIIDKATGAKKGELNTGNVKPGYITNDDAGNLVFCSRVWNYWVDYVFFEVYYMTPGSSEVKKLVSCHDDEYYPSYIGAGLSVKGDVTGKAAIAAPWEGVEGVTGDNMVLCWQIENGAKVGSYVKGTLTGFIGIGWLAGYWMQSPDNFPGFALISDTLADGAVFACYEENVLYYVDQNFACTALSDETILDSNNTPNAMDIRTINGKQYLAVSGGTYFPQWCNPPMRIVDMSTKAVVAEPVTHSFNIGEAAVAVGASAAVRMEATEGGMIVYHINNNCSVIEAIKVPLD